MSSSQRLVRFIPAVSLALALAIGGLAPFGLASFVAGTASAQLLDEDELMAKRLEWQERYRTLLEDRQRYTDNIAKSKKNYAQAQRRNYPRGGARQQFLLDAQQAEKALAATEQAIEELFVEARQSEVPPGWLYEVEDEPISYDEPAAPDTRDDEADRTGRNPLYLEDDDEDDDR